MTDTPIPLTRPRIAFAMRTGLREQVLSTDALGRLERLAEVLSLEELTEFESEAATRLLARTDVLITSWDAPIVDDAALDRAPHLKAVVHAAGSVRHHLTPAVWERGVLVASAADANAIPVAEYTLAAILLSGKAVLPLADAYRADPANIDVTQWRSIGNYGKRVGIIGASRIGRLVCGLVQPFAFEVVIADPFLDEPGAARLGARLVTLEELCVTSDIVTVHAPELPETHHLVDDALLASMHDGATLINTARGSLVDQDALTRELVSGRLNAVLDVTAPEPLPAGSPLLRLPNVLTTPHIAGSLGTELRRLGDAAVGEVERLARGQTPLGAVALDDLGHLA
ncbi:2-hydroxyacid dehydrogenase [Knoellia sinensis KCTC 19936]|uniref:2-hydroxyacid dehydrogenase n=1 Tax=Knoellia sinensis KCTC 19936 TaxID=1385520 RepID=A0A0A0JCJ1_9MICO|nr:hydroxyacid dehydrogenase [Knoellia sinensis]KGN34883.1 2-hydroxyacid dehydrogenase [Knoellia sinensis KCTC 19936]